MRFLLSTLIFLCLLVAGPVHGRTDFKEGWEKADPAPPGSGLGTEDVVKAHQAFLDHAAAERNELHQVYGLLYLFYDALDVADYKEATRYILEAEALAKRTGEVDLQGAVSYRHGVLQAQTRDLTGAIGSFTRSDSLCRLAGDTLGMAVALEQLGATYGMLDDTERTALYYTEAFKLIERSGNQQALCAALNNFGSILNRQERPSQAIPYLERALGIARQNLLYDTEAAALNNLAESYFMLNRYDESLKTLNACILFNNQHAYTDNLITNYQGMANVYEAKGDLTSALLFTNKYYELRDSLLGGRTQLEIADLETKYNSQEKELALRKSQAALASSRYVMVRGAWILCSVVLLAAVALWRWRLKVAQARHEAEQSRASLTDLTHVLLEKNTRIASLEEQLAVAPAAPVLPVETQKEVLPAMDPTADPGPAEPSPAPPPERDDELYNQRILTDEDWALFKLNFDKAYPGFLLRFRKAFPALSNAEERLVLFIKLSLDTKEIAAVLGISADSVKKGRNRLRKRLELVKEMDLEEFIRSF